MKYSKCVKIFPDLNRTVVTDPQFVIKMKNFKEFQTMACLSNARWLAWHALALWFEYHGK